MSVLLVVGGKLSSDGSDSEREDGGAFAAPSTSTQYMDDNAQDFSYNTAAASSQDMPGTSQDYTQQPDAAAAGQEEMMMDEAERFDPGAFFTQFKGQNSETAADSGAGEQGQQGYEMMDVGGYDAAGGDGGIANDLQLSDSEDDDEDFEEVAGNEASNADPYSMGEF